MIRTTRYKEFITGVREDALTLGVSCSTKSVVVAEQLGHLGFDFVIVDTEVLAIDPETVENMLRAVEVSGAVTMVKAKSNDPIVISDMMNAGAPICKIPHARSPEDLRRAADSAFFHPRGHRGLCAASRANLFGAGLLADLMESTNALGQIVPILEDREAVDRIDELMAVDGIELYDIGPQDLAHSYGLSPDKGFANPQVSRALDKIVESANKHGKKVMTTPSFGKPLSPELVKGELVDRGVRTIFLRADLAFLATGSRNILKLRELL